MPAVRVDSPATGGDHKDCHPSWASALGFAFLTYTTASAAHKSIHNSSALSFLLIAYFDLVSLFWCLRQFEAATTTERNKGRLKVAVWILATLLTSMFSYKAAAIVPWPVALIIWCLALATTIGGFYSFFVYRGIAS